MYRVNIRENKYRAVLIGSKYSPNTVIESEDWRTFSNKLKRAMEHEASITLHETSVAEGDSSATSIPYESCDRRKE